MPHHRQQPPLKRSPRAFTIAELVLCMSIMVVLASIAIPRYGRAIAAYRARAAAQRLANDLGQIQSQARMTSTSQLIQFKSDSYVMATVRDLDTASAGSTVSLLAEPYRATMPSISLAGGANSITFDGFGVPSAAGTITIQSGNSTRIVLIDAQTGKATVQ